MIGAVTDLRCGVALIEFGHQDLAEAREHCPEVFGEGVQVPQVDARDAVSREPGLADRCRDAA